MNKAELKENIIKIEDLLREDHYKTGFELLISLNNSELTESLSGKIFSCLEFYYIQNGAIEDAFAISIKLNILELFQMYLAKVSSIDSAIIEFLNEQSDLAKDTCKLVEFKYSLSKIKHDADNGTDGKDSLFENFNDLKFPESYLSELYQYANFEFCKDHNLEEKTV